ncbi:MAG: universal stress protein [Myxococcales bacterium]|nr:universal stress protein [Myxococcales bacterium]
MTALARNATLYPAADLLQNPQLQPARVGVILLAVGFGQRSRNALRWATDLSRSMGMGLRLVHSAIDRLPIDPLFPLTAEQQESQRQTWLGALAEALRDWAINQGGVEVAPEDIRVRYSKPTQLICEEAAQPDVRLVILGGLPSTDPQVDAQPPHGLLRRCPRPMLFIGPKGLNPVVVAATDCSNPALPVLAEAYRMAGALGDQILLVHNIDHYASQFAERIGMPLTPAMADSVANQTREWLEERVMVGDVMITRESDNASGVLGVVRDLHADLLVVGVKPAEQAQHGTAERILKAAQRSVMFVPVMSRSKSLPMHS